jgi:hypothetical protein
MSQENVEIVKGLYAAAETMDREHLLGALPALIEQVSLSAARRVAAQRVERPSAPRSIRC